MKEKTVDMTHGTIMPQLIHFAIPVLLGALFQKIYNLADVFIVGRFLGDEALAAVSIGGSGSYVLFSIMMGLTTGVSVVCSQYYGAGENHKVMETFATSIYVMLGCTAIITVLGVLGTRPLLLVLQTSKELMPQAYTYLVIMFAGSLGTMLYNWIASVLRALGNSVVPVLFLVVSSVLNIVLDVLFVAVVPLGVAGAALATVLAQVISGALCLVYALKIFPMLRILPKDMKYNQDIAKLMLKYGVPAGLQMSIINISDMTLQAKINTYGTAMVVAYGVAIKVEHLGWEISSAVGAAVSTFVGQNIGAGRFDRVKRGVRSALLLNLICYGVYTPIVWIFAKSIMKVFTDSSLSVRYGMEYMRIFSVFFLVGGFLGIFHNMLRAAGDVLVTVLMGVSEIITRIGLTFLLSYLFGYYGLWWVSPITWVCATMVGAVRYYSGTWKKKAQVMVSQEAIHE